MTHGAAAGLRQAAGVQCALDTTAHLWYCNSVKEVKGPWGGRFFLQHHFEQNFYVTQGEKHTLLHGPE